MNTAFHICLWAIGILAVPIVLWFAAVPVFMLWHGLTDVIKHKQWDSLWEAWFGLLFLFMMLAGLFAWLSEE